VLREIAQMRRAPCEICWLTLPWTAEFLL